LGVFQLYDIMLLDGSNGMWCERDMVKVGLELDWGGGDGGLGGIT
jgi:hypothetical protein